MKIHQKTPELENRDSGPERVFLPESVTERSSGPEFRRNLQPSFERESLLIDVFLFVCGYISLHKAYGSFLYEIVIVLLLY